MATTQLSARRTQAGTAFASSTLGYVYRSQCPGAYLTSNSQSGSSPNSQLPKMVATASTSPKSSTTAALTPDSTPGESKDGLSSSSLSATRTQQQTTTMWLRLFIFMIFLMGIHSFLDMVLWLPTLYLLAVTFIHLIYDGYNSSLKFCGFRAFVLTAAVYTIFHSVLEDPNAFYGAGILLYLIFGSRHDLLSPSSAYRSICHSDLVQEVESNNEIKDFTDISLAQRKLRELEAIDDVFKGMLRLPALYELDLLDPTEARPLCLSKLFNGQQLPATDELAVGAHLSLSLITAQIDFAPIDVRVDTPAQNYAPVATIVSVHPCIPVTTTVAPALSPTTALTKTVPIHQAVASSNGHSPEDLISKQESEHFTTFETANATTLVHSTSGQAQTETLIEQSVDADIRGDSTTKSRALSGVDYSVVLTGGSTTAPAGSITVSEGSVNENSVTPLSSLVDTNSSSRSTKPTASDSVGSCRTASSSDGGIDLEVCDTPFLQDCKEEAAKEVATATISCMLVTVDAKELDQLFELHGRPSFHDGPLHEVCDLAWRQRLADVHSRYNPDDLKSCIWEVGSGADRPIAGDAKDIEYILKDVWQNLPAHQQLIITNTGLGAYSAGRDGTTGYNFFMCDLELLWHQAHPPVFNGHVLEVLDLKVIVSYEMARSRAHRSACPRGIVPYAGVYATHRLYLTGAQEITVNEGCCDYGLCTEDAAQSETIRRLEAHPNHAGAKSTNPVPGWLDRTVGFTFYDPNAYLPCICGKKARQAHLESRLGIEPGYDPEWNGSTEPEPALLGEEALEEDRKRKAQDDGLDGGYPRSEDFAQECPLHAIPTNNPWILMDGVEDPNNLLVGAKGELPAPGFTVATVFPAGFRIPYGFVKPDFTTLPPRCEHGHLHPPFVDACMRCFPTGEHDGDCAECDQHDAVKAIKQNPMDEDVFIQACEGWDNMQMAHMHREKAHEKHMIEAWRNVVSDDYYRGWSALTDV